MTALAAFLLAPAACSAQSPEQSVPAPEFRVTLPSSAPLTLSDIETLKNELSKADGNPPVQRLSAAAFDDYSARPRRNDAEWVAFLSIYAGVRDLALDHGWDVLVEGFTQATDPIGTTDPLSRRRAAAARNALLDLGYPPARVAAVGRGVGGPRPEDRRVLITFVRSDR
jgi:hypothetical protein